ncbi:MAG: DUF2855 family protein, partial [Rhizobiales bacterium]|nr:DUF2855 family protein [Rhizobacter sp.]
IYNQYARLAARTSRECVSDDWQALIRPLFFTSFVLDDQLADAAYFGAATVLLSSASSKTALGTAFLLRARGDVRVLGLTSARHAEFVEGASCFDAVLGYDDLGALKTQGDVAYIDFSGDAALRRAVHERFGTSLAHSLAVGSTHWAVRAEEGDPPPGVALQTFFGPAQIRKRRADWGAEALHARYDAAEKRFIAAARQWLRIVQRHGAAEVAQAWSALLEGQASPDQASIGRLLLDAQVGAADEDAAMSFLRSRPSLAQ